MSIIDKLSSVIGLKGNENEILLAKEISDKNDSNSVKELVENLKNRDKRIQSDCIKTLYETAYRKPELVAAYYSEFLKLLSSKNNRLVWGAMITLAAITDLKHKEIF